MNILNKIFLLMVVLLGLQQVAHAKIWIVDNNTNGIGDFSTFDASVAGMAAGDTLYLVPSTTNYTIGTAIDKEIHVFGTGYWLAENNIYQGEIGTAYSRLSADATTDMLVGSEGSTFNSLVLVDFFVSNASQLSFNRCYISNISTQASSGFISDIIINQCFLFIATGFVNSNISNSYVEMYASGSIDIRNSTYDQCVFSNTSGGVRTRPSNCTINNSVFLGSGNQSNGEDSDFFNVSENGNVFNNNTFPFASGTYAISGSSNIFDVSINEISRIETPLSSLNRFVGPDNLLQLPTDSPARGAGSSGQDMGMFGGNTPYVLSMVPDLPLIQSLYTDAVVNQGSELNINITIKADN